MAIVDAQAGPRRDLRSESSGWQVDMNVDCCGLLLT